MSLSCEKFPAAFRPEKKKSLLFNYYFVIHLIFNQNFPPDVSYLFSCLLTPVYRSRSRSVSRCHTAVQPRPRSVVRHHCLIAIAPLALEGLPPRETVKENELLELSFFNAVYLIQIPRSDRCFKIFFVLICHVFTSFLESASQTKAATAIPALLCTTAALKRQTNKQS